jgi:protein-S-isoprenylcysteine O-methyltransferase Ste14
LIRASRIQGSCDLPFALLQLGLALLVNSVSLVFTLVLAFALMAFVVVPREERYLGRRFPGEYPSYQAATRRWI